MTPLISQVDFVINFYRRVNRFQKFAKGQREKKGK